MKVIEVNFHSMETQNKDIPPSLRASWSSWSFPVPSVFILISTPWSFIWIIGYCYRRSWYLADWVQVYIIVTNVINRAFTDYPVSFNSLDIDSLFLSPQWLFQTVPILFKFPFLVTLSMIPFISFLSLVVKAHSLLQILWESSVSSLFSFSLTSKSFHIFSYP